MKDRYFSPQDVADTFGISYDKALEFIKFSGVEFVQIGRQYRVSENKLNEYLYPKKPKKIKFNSRPIYQIIERK